MGTTGNNKNRKNTNPIRKTNQQSTKKKILTAPQHGKKTPPRKPHTPTSPKRHTNPKNHTTSGNGKHNNPKHPARDLNATQNSNHP
ncbi:hypothetical protein AAGG42_22475, partial [Stenotrophomonas maltophilia]|uniref:hypothetical protein n=1 Tax=Stenotrophomonas maltophilia TaxID=40324 RepID=UPI00314513D5